MYFEPPCNASGGGFNLQTIKRNPWSLGIIALWKTISHQYCFIAIIMINIFFGGGKFLHCANNLTNFVTIVKYEKKCKNCKIIWEKIHQTFEITKLEKKRKIKIMIIMKKLNSFSRFFKNKIQMYLGMENIKLTTQFVWIHRCLVSIR